MCTTLFAAAAPMVASPKTLLPKIRPALPEIVNEKFQSLPFESQELNGLFQHRMQVNIQRRLVHVSPEALLASFKVRNAQSGYIGEHPGKFLDAACNSLRYIHNAELRSTVDQVAQTLIAHQEPDGYLGTYPPEQRWKGWDVWVHKYTLIGLLSYYQFTDDTAVLGAARKIGDLLSRIFGDGSGMRDIIAAGIHIGMDATSVLEPMCALYRLTGEHRYLEFCKYIVRAYEQPNGPHIVSSLLDHGSVYKTANGKAYEMLSNFNGLIDLYRLTGDTNLLNAVLRAWDNIVRTQLYCTGTVSANEHFQRTGELLSLQSSNVGETCVTVTWLQLNWRLLRLTGEARFGQEIERTVYNHLLAAQDAQNGNISYFTSMCGCKEHGDYMLCCVSSGPRGISLIPQLVWGLEKNAFVVNLYADGQASFEINGIAVQVTSKTRFPITGVVALHLSPAVAVPFTLRLRVPEWSRKFEVTIGTRTYAGIPGRMLDIKRIWRRNTAVTIHMEMVTRAIPAGPKYPQQIALQRGPQILALEKNLNSSIPYLSRTALGASSISSTIRSATNSNTSRPVYEVDGVALQNPGSARLEQCALRLVPFADAKEYRVWISTAAATRTDIPPVTLFARARTSEVNLRLEPTDQQPSQDFAEYLTDENPRTFCAADPRRHRVYTDASVLSGKKGEPVWFAVILDEPTLISRVIFRHGVIEESGGWFDTSQLRPRVEIVRTKPPEFDRGVFIAFLNLEKAQWETVAELAQYPTSTASLPPKLADGQLFEIRLPKPETVYAIRIVGKCGGDYASCSELSAYT
jgi:uncharacterized protein